MNPFIFGEVVRDADFIDRKEELETLVKDLSDGQKVFLIAPRRYGKTSLLLAAAEKLKTKGVRVIYLDLFKTASVEQFAAALGKAAAEMRKLGFAEAVKFIGEFVSGLRPQFSVNPDGSLSLGVDASPPQKEVFQMIDNLLAYPQELAVREKKPVVVMFDEFQEIVSIGGEPLEKLMRAVIQKQRNVGYVFCGSKKTMMNEMVSKKSRAFFGMGPVTHLEKIPLEYFEKYLAGNFARGGFDCPRETLRAIVSSAGGIPYYIQYLAHELWDLKAEEKKITDADVERAVALIAKRNTPLYQNLWENLPQTQKRLLQGLAANPGAAVFSGAFITRFQLNSSALVKKSLSLLVSKDIIEKEAAGYIFTDYWMGVWVRQNCS
ncbi:MAG: ATP-binding protein [Elusimicrobiota bacterium]|nr:ATP-binding protein [Elusimicrobiota bacterium]